LNENLEADKQQGEEESPAVINLQKENEQHKRIIENKDINLMVSHTRVFPKLGKLGILP